jgi:hypothetical protein
LGDCRDIRSGKVNKLGPGLRRFRDGHVDRDYSDTIRRGCPGGFCRSLVGVIVRRGEGSLKSILRATAVLEKA